MFNNVLKHSILSKVTVLLIVVSLLAATMCTVCADENDGSKVSDNQIIQSYIKAMNDHDGDSIISLTPSCDLKEWQLFFTNEDNRLSNMGIFCIESASLERIVPLTDYELAPGTDLDKYNEDYDNSVRGYFVGIDLSVKEESKYYFNGVNYRLVVLATEDNATKVIEFSHPSLWLIDHLVGNNKTEADENLQKAIDIIKARCKGLILDSKGNVIETNRASEEKLREERGEKKSSIRTDFPDKPDSIRVYRNDTGKIDTVDFYEYCKNVLPIEWGSGSASEALRAGAQCVKMVGWYRVYFPKYDGRYDVKDSDADQVYIPNTATKACTKAINEVGGYGLESKSGYIIYAQYKAGKAGQYGKRSSGVVQQKGTYKQAADGKNYWEMLQYYYDDSFTTNNEKLSTFAY